jgi:ribonucleotide reductase alpha subunit
VCRRARRRASGPALRGGLVFRDAIGRANPTPELGALEATNPCGEVPLLAYESCNLGSLNLARLVLETRGQAVFDWPRLDAVAGEAVRFLDDVIEVGRYPLEAVAQATRRTRKIGLGVMGFAEALIRLGISYDSAEAERFAERVMHAIAEAAARASNLLAAERGVFPAWRGGLPARNATRTAIAPTGTIGIIAGTSASIEPLFALAYRRAWELDLKGITVYRYGAQARPGARARRRRRAAALRPRVALRSGRVQAVTRDYYEVLGSAARAARRRGAQALGKAARARRLITRSRSCAAWTSRPWEA